MARVLNNKKQVLGFQNHIQAPDHSDDTKDGTKRLLIHKQESPRARSMKSDSDEDPIGSASSPGDEAGGSSDFMDTEETDQKHCKQHQLQGRIPAGRRQPARAAAVAAQAAAAAQNADSEEDVDIVEDSEASQPDPCLADGDAAVTTDRQQQQRSRAMVISENSIDAAAARGPGQQCGAQINNDKGLSDSGFEAAALECRQQQTHNMHSSVREAPVRAALSSDSGSASEGSEQKNSSSHDSRPQVHRTDQKQLQLQIRMAPDAIAGAETSNRCVTHGDLQHKSTAAEQPSRRTRGAATATVKATASAPAARPRRAAAAIAAAATAAALRSEARSLHFDTQHSSDDLLAADDSDSDLEPANSDEEEVLVMSTGSDDSGDETGDEPDTGAEVSGVSDDDNSQQQAKQAAVTAARLSAATKRSGRVVNCSLPVAGGMQPGSSSAHGGDGDDDDNDEVDAVDEHRQLEGSDRKQRSGGSKVLDLNAFAYGGGEAGAGRRCKAAKSSSPDPAAADGPASGPVKGRGGRDSRAGSPHAADTLSAALDAEEAETADIADACEFEPQQLAKIPKGEDVDKILAVRYQSGGDMQVLLRLIGKSYRAAIWVPSKQVEAKGRGQLLRNFVAKQAAGEGPDGPSIDPAWYQVERILEKYAGRKGKPDEYLVKWLGLEYSDSTWEKESEVIRDGQGRAALMRFKRWTMKPTAPDHLPRRPAKALLDRRLLPAFRSGRVLRDYQETSLHWMINNYYGVRANNAWKPRNCILGDEMGLGKTAQSIAVMAWLKQYSRIRGPFMVVAPLTTLGHWQREIQTWTGMNVVLYTGSARDRQLIRDTEFHYADDRSAKRLYGVRFDVLLVSYETVLKDKSELRKIRFEALILDEAHRLKSRTSATRAALLELPVHWWLLLSGTPVQNNMRELQGLMSVVDEEQYGDLEDFLGRFGDTAPTVEQIKALQAALAPVLLRRMKEDVENLPEKEEVVIWVELTQEQKRYYKALYAQQIGSLLQGVAKNNLPGMRNLAMELRKMCCHPFLCNGLEQDMLSRWEAAKAAGGEGTAEGDNREVEAITRASGKMLLLHKLLPKLCAEGRQVLIFSQFKIMLDVLEDYLTACKYPCERIDGDTNHKDRQAAIDRFMAAKDKRGPSNSRGTTPTAADGDQDRGNRSRSATPATAGDSVDDHEAPFVFLLSTKAGGQGITLTSADTVIIYDSDWNPQNDLQAMGRCHRIGQDREVTVYRLVSKNTYEEQLFRTASRKYGLDEAILGFSGAGDNPENDAVRIMKLLKDGAHAFANDGAAGDAPGGEEKGMAQEDIGQILAGRSEKRQLGSRKGNTFSIAHFAAVGGAEAEAEMEEEAVDAKSFWAGLLPEAAAAHAAAQEAAKQPELLGRRRRTVVDYREKNMLRKIDSDDDENSDFDGEEGSGTKRHRKSDAGDEADGAPAQGQDAAEGARKKQKKAAAGDASMVFDPELQRTVKVWKASQVEAVEKQLFLFGPDRTELLLSKSGVISRQPDEVGQLASAITKVLQSIKTHQQQPAPQTLVSPAAAAAAMGSGHGVAAADDVAMDDGVKSRHSFRPEDVKALQQRLTDAQVPDMLPPATRKALLSADVLRRLMRNTESLLQQLTDHQEVHQVITAAAGVPVNSPGKPGRRFVVPKVSLSRGLPAWWSRHDDDNLLLGSYQLGYTLHKMPAVVEDIMTDPVFGFDVKVALDPVEAFKAVHMTPPPATPSQPALNADGAAEPQVPPPPAVVLSPEQQVMLGQAHAERRKIAAAAAARPGGVLLMRPKEWRRFLTACVLRLKKVRQCMLDPNYVSAPTPKKPEPIVLNHSSTAGMPAPAAAAATASPSQPAIAAAQQRLNFSVTADGKLSYKGKPVVGGIQSSAGGAASNTATLLASQQAAVRAAAAVPKLVGTGTVRQVQMAASTPPAAAAKLAPAPTASATAHGTTKKRSAATAVCVQNVGIIDIAAGSNDNADCQVAGKSGGIQTARAFKKLKALQSAGASGQQVPPKPQHQQQHSDDVVVLFEDSPETDSNHALVTAAAAATGGKPFAAARSAPPNRGLVVRQVPASTPLSQDTSVDIEEPPAAPATGRPAIRDDAHSKQQMQQLLGSVQKTAAVAGEDATTAKQQAEPHPVYGTPAAGSSQKRPSTSYAVKHHSKGDRKQRKLETFFAVQKK